MRTVFMCKIDSLPPSTVMCYLYLRALLISHDYCIFLHSQTSLNHVDPTLGHRSHFGSQTRRSYTCLNLRVSDPKLEDSTAGDLVPYITASLVPTLQTGGMKH
jgi:hypothetical protein